MSENASIEIAVEEHILPSELNLNERRKIIPAIENKPTTVPVKDLVIDGKLTVYPEIVGHDYFKIQLKKNELVFQAGSFIGLIPINDRIVLDIRTRVPVRNLERLLLIAEYTPKEVEIYLRNYLTTDQTFPSLIEVLAKSFIKAMVEIERNGLYREYLNKIEDTSFPRGRIMMGQTLQRHLGQGKHYSVSASWFEPSVDVAANRCLKYAVWLLAEKHRLLPPQKGWRALSARLNELFQLFGGVHLDLSKSFLRDKIVVNPHLMPNIRDYYVAPLHIAKTIIEDRGISLDRIGDDVLLPSFVLKMDDVFERYVRSILREKVSSLGTDLRVLDGNVAGINGARKLLFDNPPSSVAQPDIAFKIENLEQSFYPIVIDTKYKDIETPERDDLNQIITYGFSYRAPSVVIVHPKIPNSAGGLNFLGKIDKLSVYQYAFDLANENPKQEEEQFFQQMLSLIPQLKKPI